MWEVKTVMVHADARYHVTGGQLHALVLSGFRLMLVFSKNVIFCDIKQHKRLLYSTTVHEATCVFCFCVKLKVKGKLTPEVCNACKKQILFLPQEVKVSNWCMSLSVLYFLSFSFCFFCKRLPSLAISRLCRQASFETLFGRVWETLSACSTLWITDLPGDVDPYLSWLHHYI